MLAVDGYAGRLERLEEKLRTEQLESRISSLSVSIESLLYQMTQDLQYQLQETKGAIQEKLSELDIVSAISDVRSQLDDLEEKLFDGCTGFNSIAYNVDRIHDAVTNSSNSDIEEKLDSISSELYWIKSAAEDAKYPAVLLKNG